MTRKLLPALLLLLGALLGFVNAARATAGPPTTGRPLAEALNPDGTLKAGAKGSFDARAFRMGTAPDGRPVFRPAGALGAGDERWQDGFGLPIKPSTVVRTVIQAGNDVYIGGSFSAFGNVEANNVARWNGTAWSSLGMGNANGLTHINGSRASVYALAVAANGDLYVGGEFTQAGGVSANNVARWNGTAWSSLGTGITGGLYPMVYALAVAGNGDVYAGGYFTQAGGATANAIAKWDGTAWNSVGTGSANGVSTAIYALAVAGNGDVYAGGDFTQAGGVSASNVARWNGTAWNSLGTGTANTFNYSVYALAVAANGDVYAGGAFTQAGGVSANRVARWNGTAWNSLGTGISGGVSRRVVTTLAVAGNGDVYAGGDFDQAGGVPASRVARWNGTAWSSLGTGSTNGLNNPNGLYIEYTALAVAGNGDVYVGGDFDQAGGVAASRVARWNGTAWRPVGTGTVNGVDNTVYALAVAGNGDVYAGGVFNQAGELSPSRVARWNGTAWNSLGTGSTNGVAGYVYALAVAANGDVYVGGVFSQAGGVSATNVARWNGTAWSSLGTGSANGLNGIVYALAVAGNGDVYAGGRFTQADGSIMNRVARWNGTAWSSLGTGSANGLNGIVYALALAGNGDVYVGGVFTQAGGVPANHVARWNGTAWNSLGTGSTNGMNDYIYALAVAGNGDVYAGGKFNQAGGATANAIAKWNGTAWSSLGTGSANGLNGAVSALVVASNGDVYAGGGFDQAGGVPASRVARWNGTAWSSLGTGTNSGVLALALKQDGKLYASGSFTATGDGSKAMFNFGVYDQGVPLATAASVRAKPAGQLFPNPAHGTATLRLPATAARQPLTLTDALGRLVRQYPAPPGAEAVLDLRGLPAGVYVVRYGQLSQRLVVE